MNARKWAYRQIPIVMPDLSKSSQFGQLSLFGKVLWPMLLVASDDTGRGLAEPDIIKWRVCPNVNELTTERIAGALVEMVNLGLLSIQRVDKYRIYQVTGWDREQYRSTVRRSRGSVRDWDRLRQQILERDHHICQYCGESANHVDHIIPIVHGGSDDPDNLVAACRKCNSSKSGRTPTEAGMILGGNYGAR